MHADELDIDVGLVRRLLAGQCPQWADLPLERVRSAGTDNAIYRLGRDMAVRLPRRVRTAVTLEKEREWLPRLAPHLPLEVPVPLVDGTPADGYPWVWSVYRWLGGEDATRERIADLRDAATRLAGFVAALRRIDATGGPPPGEHNFFRGVALEARDAGVRASLVSPRDEIDVDAVTAVWKEALGAPEWPDPAVWITETSTRATCLSGTVGSAPSSTSGASAWATPPAT
jgi:aminoglycoside phosphotransferase (APT) family kinase protein